jgi:hypothetical protein
MLLNKSCAIAAGSASARTIPGSFPPSSRETRFTVVAADFVPPVQASSKQVSPFAHAHPIYIISKGRWKRPLTARALERMPDVDYRIVVEPQEADLYRESFTKFGFNTERILVAPENFSALGQGSIPVRNFVWQHSIDSGAAWHWLLDDNISEFFRLHENLNIAVRTGLCFKFIEDFANRADKIAIAGMQATQFCKRRAAWPAVQFNSRVYSCTLIRNDLKLRVTDQHGRLSMPFARWRGRYNEDTDLCLRALKEGWNTALFIAFNADKAVTMTMKGGNTDELYRGDGRRKMAESLMEQHPDVAKVAWKFRRWQHSVDYRPFKKNLDWKNIWEGMPEFAQYNIQPYKTIKVILADKIEKRTPNGVEKLNRVIFVHFRQNDYRKRLSEFAAMVGVELNPRRPKRTSVEVQLTAAQLARLLKQTITPRQPSLWHPVMPITRYSGRAWVIWFAGAGGGRPKVSLPPQRRA